MADKYLGNASGRDQLVQAVSPCRIDRAADPVEQFVKRAKGIINKISGRTFAKLSSDLLSLPVTSQEMLEELIEAIFDEALEDVLHQDLYASLCKLLGDKAVYWSERYLKVQHMKKGPAGAGWYFDVSGIGQWQGPHATESTAKSESHSQTNFKRLILNRCQQEFMKDDHFKYLDAEQADDEARRTAGGGLTPAEEKELAERAAARDYTRLKAKRRMLANIAFIGQLYRIEGMLTTTTMHFCIGRLLNGGILPDEVKPDERQIEGFFKLMVLIGAKLESDESRDPELESRRLGTIMQITDRLSRHPLLATRVRLLMHDLIELRHKRWDAAAAAALIARSTVSPSLGSRTLASDDDVLPDLPGLMIPNVPLRFRIVPPTQHDSLADTSAETTELIEHLRVSLRVGATDIARVVLSAPDEGLRGVIASLEWMDGGHRFCRRLATLWGAYSDDRDRLFSAIVRLGASDEDL